MNSWWKIWRNWLILSTLFACFTIQAQPRLALILDGIGLDQQDEKTLELPLEVALTFIPYSAWGRALALQAWRQERETLLHLPVMIIGDPAAQEWEIDLNQDQWQVQYRLKKALADIPFVKGINSHRDNIIKLDPDRMSWIMEILSRKGLYLVDGKDLSQSSAYEQALAWGVSTIQGDLFLDANADTLAQQWQQVLQQATTQGQVVVLCNSSELILTFLAQALGQLSEHGIQLVALSELFNQPLLLPIPAPSELGSP